MRTASHTLRIAAVVTLAGLACEFGVTNPDSNVARRVVVNGLEETLTLSPDVVRWGDTLIITSTVINQSAAAVAVVHRVCGLDLQTNLSLRQAYVTCAGYSASGDLNPGDTVVGVEQRVVAAAPGTYTLRVRHLLNPDVWLAVPMTLMDCSVAPTCGVRNPAPAP